MNISYELVKELKDAGFPFTTLQQVDAEKVYLVSNQGKGYRIPTLEELIETFDLSKLENYGVFDIMYNWRGNKKWMATYGISNVGEGETAFIAVARLWLALNRGPHLH